MDAVPVSVARALTQQREEAVCEVKRLRAENERLRGQVDAARGWWKHTDFDVSKSEWRALELILWPKQLHEHPPTPPREGEQP